MSDVAIVLVLLCGFAALVALVVLVGVQGGTANRRGNHDPAPLEAGGETMDFTSDSHTHHGREHGHHGHDSPDHSYDAHAGHDAGHHDAGAGHDAGGHGGFDGGHFGGHH